MTTFEKLESLANNLWWSWNPDALELFKQLNEDVFAFSGNNPIAALQSANADVLRNSDYERSVSNIYDRFRNYIEHSNVDHSRPHIGYFCMEYGLHESIPIYSGGLGILAGDHAKAASDSGLPFTAVGLFLRDGYFKQGFDKQANQLAEYPGIDPTHQPFRLAVDGEGDPVEVAVQISKRSVNLRAQLLDIGRTKMVLLDADIPGNSYSDRFLTRRLYGGDRTTRLQQEIILGIGGLRMLRALGIRPDLFHMNEGHCAFLGFELMRELREAHVGHEQIVERVRQQCLFTTHTPVKAGHDRFDPALFDDQMSQYPELLGVSMHDLIGFGRVNPDDHQEQFTMTVLGLKLARSANGVSKLNGAVAREQWKDLFPDRTVSDVPIGHVTNGVHLPTWTSHASRTFLQTHLGDWQNKPENWKAVDQIPDAELWNYRSMLRKQLVDFVTTKVSGQDLEQVSSLRSDVLTIGFARRFATYKRAPLLFHDLDRIKRLFTSAANPIQVIYSGKAHPADKEGQAFIKEIFEYTQLPDFKGRLIYVEGYDMEIGRMLVSGADVWLNNPRRPYEASGTSGQKVAIHGGLNLSILDGWWPEGFDGTNGWAIGTDSSSDYKDPSVQDPEDAELLYSVLENDVIPKFYDRDTNGVPVGWTTFMRNAMRVLPYQFSARRMVNDYEAKYYTSEVLESA